ncbi:type II secretion system F family protein [Rhizobium sp. RCC_161_2]|uniref:type II secretion system F family protein n=1 Tax=Rhizobium sp. RCC_161_2 TaxID=3239219 RepID=UPI003524D69A
MPNFSYVGFSKDGTRKRGVLEALGEAEARLRLRADGLKVLELSEARRSRSRIAFPVTRILPAKANLERFFADIAMLMDAGLGLDRALKAMAADQGNQANSMLAKELIERLASGKAPSEAFQAIGDAGRDIAALIASGEQTGKLPVIFGVIANNLERQRAQRSQITEAIAYPAFLVLMMCVALLIVTFFLVPAILPIFEGAGRPAPLMIRSLDVLRALLVNWGPVLALAPLLVGLLALRSAQRARLKAFISNAAISLPLIGAFIRKQGLARYLHSLALLLGNGVEMPKALAFAAATCPIATYSTPLETVRERVLSGSRLPDALGEAAIFPSAVVSLVAIGDEVNTLSTVLFRSAELLEGEALRSQGRLLALMTPVITIAMGGLIGGLVISVMSALLGINDLSLQ